MWQSTRVSQQEVRTLQMFGKHRATYALVTLELMTMMQNP
jgi:hypothetical protein